MVKPTVPKPAPGPGSYNSVAAQYARAKALRDAEENGKTTAGKTGKQDKSTADRLNDVKKERFLSEWNWVLGAFVWFL
jgi:phosphatidylinositol glycan class O